VTLPDAAAPDCCGVGHTHASYGWVRGARSSTDITREASACRLGSAFPCSGMFVVSEVEATAIRRGCSLDGPAHVRTVEYFINSSCARLLYSAAGTSKASSPPSGGCSQIRNSTFRFGRRAV
jgi:hypothetical protein